MERNVDSRALLMAAAVQRGAVGSTVASKIDGYLADCAELGRPVDALLARIDDPALRDDLRRSFDKVRAKRTFGLVFESHLPERVTLPSHPIRRGVRVTRRDDQRQVFFVGTVKRGIAQLTPIGTDDDSPNDQPTELPVSELVVVAEFGEPIYPGLKHLESVHRGGDKPAHTVINAENHHALELLQFTHAGKIDCIYIDPPYNTGARDWKYDNNYVDGDDSYRHSKWLAFMERRLLLARELLNPDDSFLIVTIDEKEYLRLGLLLEQTFPDARIQMVSIVISPLGQARKQELARVEEYAFFVFFGEAGPAQVSDDLLTEHAAARSKVRWEWLLRGGTHSERHERPNLFFPIFVDQTNHRIVGVGDSIPLATERESIKPPDGTVAVWPLSTRGAEGNWRCSPAYLRSLLEGGWAKLGAYDSRNDRYSVLYLGKAQLARIEAGEINVVGRDAQGAAILEGSEMIRRTDAKTVWSRSSHRAGEYGTNLLKRLVPSSSFPFPKSLYAVEDAVRIATGNKPDAVILDFFAGSGTTAHAVARLNRQDGGRRQSITVTNNEVSAAEAKTLTDAGFRDGDPEWEALGIFEHITRPRITAAVTGRTSEGEPVKGDYKFTDEFPMAEGFDENVEFFELTYEDAQRVDADRSFDAIAPLLWLRSGAVGPILTEQRDPAGERRPYVIGDHYAILFDTDQWRSFVDEAPEGLVAAFIVTDSPSTFSTIVRELPGGIDTVRLYRNYLATFEIGRPQSRGGSR